MIDTLAGALTDVMRWLTEEEISGVVIGGVAASLLGRPRMTRDVDAIVLGDEIGWDTLVASAHRYGIAPRIDDPLEFARRTRVLRGMCPAAWMSTCLSELCRSSARSCSVGH